MKKIPSIFEYVIDLFQLSYPVSYKRMFGAYGIFYHSEMIAIFSNENLYIKANEKNLPIFLNHKLGRFSYISQGKQKFLNYYQIPDDIFDNVDTAKYWLNLAI
jgi:DNA transformation protein